MCVCVGGGGVGGVGVWVWVGACVRVCGYVGGHIWGRVAASINNYLFSAPQKELLVAPTAHVLEA